MPKTIQATGEATPKTISAVFAEWKRQFEIASTPGPSERADAAVDRMCDLKDAMFAIPAVTLQDFATKITVASQDGHNEIDMQVIKEAQRIANGATETPQRSVSGRIMDVEDKIATARYLSQAIFMAANGLSDREEMNAFQVIAEQITTILFEVRDELDAVREEM